MFPKKPTQIIRKDFFPFHKVSANKWTKWTVLFMPTPWANAQVLPGELSGYAFTQPVCRKHTFQAPNVCFSCELTLLVLGVYLSWKFPLHKACLYLCNHTFQGCSMEQVSLFNFVYFYNPDQARKMETDKVLDCTGQPPECLYFSMRADIKQGFKWAHVGVSRPTTDFCPVFSQWVSQSTYRQHSLFIKSFIPMYSYKVRGSCVTKEVPLSRLSFTLKGFLPTMFL